MKNIQKITILLFTTLLISQCWMGTGAPRDNSVDPNRDNAPGIVIDGLENWWKFNGNLEDIKNNIVDQNPILNTDTSLFTYINNRFGDPEGALSFSNGGFFIINNTKKFDIDGSAYKNFTVELWFRYSTSGGGVEGGSSGGGTPVKNIFSNSDFLPGSCNSGSIGYGVHFDTNNNKIQLIVPNTANGTCDTFTATNGIKLDTWYHVFIELSGTSTTTLDTVNIYALDGNNIGGPVLSIFIDTPVPSIVPYIAANAPPIVGQVGIEIDDLRYYNILLDDAQKMQNHTTNER